jgi:16S rRNA processing protein RimM
MIMLGVITEKRGFKGEMYVSELISERIDLPPEIDVQIGYSSKFTRKYKLVYWKSGKRTAKVRIDGINSDEMTKPLMEMGIFVDEEVLKESNPETTFTHELIGLEAIEYKSGEIIGKVCDMLFLPANDVIVIDKGKTLLSLPFIEQFIADIDLDKGKIKFILPDGSENLEEPKKVGYNAEKN